MVSHHPTNFGDHSHCGNRDIIFFIAEEENSRCSHFNPFCGNPVEFIFQKNNKPIVFFNNRNIVSFIESCCGKGAAIENEAIRETMKKTE